MTRYVDKDAIINKIKEKRDAALMRQHNLEKIGEETIINQEVAVSLDRILSFIDTLEVKKMDLGEEYKNFVEDDPVYSKLVNNIVGKAIAKHFFELGMKLSNIKWKPCTEIPTEHWENNPAISPPYLVKCGSVNGNPILGYAHYSYASNSWMDCFHATEDGVWKVLEWTDKRDI